MQTLLFLYRESTKMQTLSNVHPSLLNCISSVHFAKYLFYIQQTNLTIFTDRVNEFSDEDEEIEFSSGEYDGTNAGAGLTGYDAKRGYACKRDMRKFRKIDQGENDGDDGALGTNQGDSDSEFENIKDKGSRAKISRVRKTSCLLNKFMETAIIPIRWSCTSVRTSSTCGNARSYELFQSTSHSWFWL